MSEETGQNETPTETVKGEFPSRKDQFKPGNKMSPGRKSLGASLADWLNIFDTQDLREDDLRRIARDKAEPVTKRGAAERMLLLVERGDVADFERLLEGDQTLRQVRDLGINTEVVKKIKVKRRTIPSEGDGPDAVEVEREIELHDRSGDEFDRICDRTEGKPKQSVTHDGDIGLRTIAEGETEAAQILAELRSRLGTEPDAADEGENTP